MNKKGFTLVELLCVIVLLSILAIQATTGVINMSKSSKESLYCTKVKIIEDVAKDYGIKYERELNESIALYNNYKSIKIKIDDLVKSGLLEADKEDLVISPIDNKSMNELEVILYLENNQIKAHIVNNICEN